MRVAVGLSGGVDSSVAALRLKEAGHEVVGITMKLWRPGVYKGGARDACFGSHEDEDIARAARLAERLGIDYKVYDCFDAYNAEVVAYFRDTYLSGRTPNPCVRCNAMLKFGLLPKLARESGCVFDKFATGHYARTACLANGRFAVLRALDEAKDQSYFLYRLSQEQLSRQLFPLGDLTKTQVREIARRHGLPSADKADSQDFYSGDPNELIGEPDRPGDIVDRTGKVLGRHAGFWHYTIGQRKGLGIGGAGEPYYVIELNACRNQVVVGRATDAVKTSLTVADMNYVALPPSAANAEIPCRVKVRSAGRLVAATLKGNACAFPAGISGVAPGQSAVFYGARTGEILCGGIIQ